MGACYRAPVRWLVGDLQGCAAPFERLLETIRFDPARDELWCVGDLINRGPDSLRTLELWDSVGGHAVFGNHEVYAIAAYRGWWPRKDDTLDDLFSAADAELWIDRLAALPLLARLPANGAAIGDVWIVHAGIGPSWDLETMAARLDRPAAERDRAWFESDAVSLATRIRCCDADGKLSRYFRGPEGAPEGVFAWDTLRRPGPWIVHGHWAFRGHYRNDAQRVMGLDSGGVYGGGLTAWCMEEDRIVTVDTPAYDPGV